MMYFIGYNFLQNEKYEKEMKKEKKEIRNKIW